ncbi:MAG: molybdopterin-dependent oxidoreductase, partial [Acidimicrobiales bacterium]|nr:molybdopterin-dependent oxidoreductase [Acidimicrobiales bacterium]
TDLAAHSLRHRPGAVDQLVRDVLAGSGELAEVRDLLAAGPFTVVLGRGSVAEDPGSTVAAAAALLDAFDQTTFLPALRRANVHGALDAGLAPGMLPGRVALDEGRDWFEAAWGRVPDSRGHDAAGILAAAAAGEIDTLVLLGADPLADFPDADLAARGLAGARTVIAVDTFPNASVQGADIVLPAAGFAETDGTTTNLEGRLTPVNQKVTPPGTARPDWMIAAELAFRLGADLGVADLDEIWAEMSTLAPALEGVTLPELTKALDGIVVGRAEPADEPEPSPAGDEAAAEDEGDGVAEPVTVAPATVAFDPPAYEAPAVDAYSLRLVTRRKLYDLGTQVQQAPALAGLVASPGLWANPADLDRLGVGADDEVRVSSPKGSLTATVTPDATVPEGTIAMVAGVGEPSPSVLIDATSAVTEVRVETIS